MKYKPIIIVAGEPNSVFSEIFLKTIKKNNFNSPIILICSKKLFLKQTKFLKQKIKFFDLNENFYLIKNFKINKLNLINVDYDQDKPFKKISSKSKNYIKNCFNVALKILNSGFGNKLINGPVSKENFLNKRYNGITEYIAEKSISKKYAMLIYNKNLSVCPLTTHIPVKNISKKITKEKIIEKVKLINLFYKKYIGIEPKIAVTGLNPHCESTDKFNEDVKIIKPSLNYLKKLKYKISGPFPSDTIFLKQNRKRFDVILGMYHDQVLTPIKTLYEYDAINITLGLPFLRISPDHGPNETMMGKNLSNPLSLIKALKFLDKN